MPLADLLARPLLYRSTAAHRTTIGQTKLGAATNGTGGQQLPARGTEMALPC